MSPDPLPAAEFSVPQSRALTAPELAPGAVFAMPAAFGAPEAKLAVPTFSAEPVERAAIAAGNKAEVPEFAALRRMLFAAPLIECMRSLPIEPDASISTTKSFGTTVSDARGESITRK